MSPAQQQLPEGWKHRQLGELVEVLDKLRVPVSAKQRAKRPGIVPYYGAAGQVGWIDEPLFDEELLLLGEDGIKFLSPMARKAYVVNGPSWVNNHAHVLRPNPTAVSTRFLEHALNTLDYTPHVNGTTRLKLTKRAMLLLSIPCPPRPEQDRVVAEVERLIAASRHTADSLRSTLRDVEVFESSTLHCEFAAAGTNASHRASLVPLSHLADYPTPGAKVKKRDYLSAGALPVVDQGDNLVGGYTNDLSARVSVTAPVIVFGDHTRRFKFVDFPFAAGADGVKLIAPEAGVSARWLWMALRASPLPDRGYGRHFQFVRELRLAVPPRPQQDRIVAEVDDRLARARAAADRIRAALDNIERFEAAVLRDAFAGRLVPPDPAATEADDPGGPVSAASAAAPSIESDEVDGVVA